MRIRASKLGPEVIKVSKNYDNILYKPGEELNIEKVVERILRRCWDNITRFPTVKSITLPTKVSERTLFRYAEKYKWPPRPKAARIVNMFEEKANVQGSYT